MRSPKPQTGQTSQSVPVTAPIGGLNGRDPLANMDPKDAYLMDNIFPGTGSVYSRQGCEEYAIGIGSPVQNLDVYTGGDGDVMLAWAGTKVYNVSTPIVSELKAGLTSALASTAMFSNAADNAQHLIAVNGLNTPWHFDGTTISDLTMTGMASGTPSTLNSVLAFKGRLYFGQKDMLGFHYLPPGQIQGVLSYFDLGQVSKLGGYLVTMASFSTGEAGDTPTDYVVFITSKGECIVYGGYDPDDTDAWQPVGRYFTAQPIGNRCTLNYGTELVVLTLDGAISFSEIRRAGDSKSRTVAGSKYDAITSKLGRFLSDLNLNKDVPGWQGLQYGSQAGDGWLILNAPATTTISGRYYHFVMNTKTNAWCRFTNWNGLCFTVYNGRLYYGTYDGRVMLADEGRMDDEESITCDVKQAYNYFEDGSGLGQLQKHFQWASLMVSCDGTPPLSGKYNVDFKEDMPSYVNELVDSTGAEWDVGAWDSSEWGGDARTQRFIITLNKGGYTGALWLRVSLNGLSLTWYATQFVMQKTRGLL